MGEYQRYFHALIKEHPQAAYAYIVVRKDHRCGLVIRYS